jgi:hypothetical protein
MEFVAEYPDADVIYSPIVIESNTLLATGLLASAVSRQRRPQPEIQ